MTLDDQEVRFVQALLDAIHEYGRQPVPEKWVKLIQEAERVRRAIS